MLNRSALQLDREAITGREDGERGGGRGDYLREAVILRISIKGGDYSRKAFNRGTAIIRGNTYIKNLDISKPFVIVKFLPVPRSFGVISRFQCNYTNGSEFGILQKWYLKIN